MLNHQKLLQLSRKCFRIDLF